MAARAMWKGVIGVGDSPVPVKLYAAITSSKVRFRLLHEADGVPVEQQLVDPTDDHPVEYADVEKGLEIAPGRYVMLDDDDFEALTPAPSRDIEVLRCVPPAALDDRWYDRAYWLGPDGDPGAYAALVEALDAEGRVALVRWVMRNIRYVGALRVRDGHLVLIKLNHAETVVDADAIEAPSGRAPDTREIALAEKLIDALEGDFEPEAFGDAYQEAVRALVEAKAEGKTPKKAKKTRKKAPNGSLADALEASLAATGGK